MDLFIAIFPSLRSLFWLNKFKIADVLPTPKKPEITFVGIPSRVF